MGSLFLCALGSCWFLGLGLWCLLLYYLDWSLFLLLNFLHWCGFLGFSLWCFFSWGGFHWSSWFSMTVMGGFLLLDVLGEDLVVLCLVILGLLKLLNLCSLDELLSSDSLLSDESLNLGGFVESLISLFDFSSNNVLSDIVLLSESEDLSDVVGSLGAESSWLISIGDTFDFSISLLGDSEGNNGKIWAANASSY